MKTKVNTGFKFVTHQMRNSQLLDRIIGSVAGAFGQEIVSLLKEARKATRYAFWPNGALDDAVSPQEWSQWREAWHQALDGQSGRPCSRAGTNPCRTTAPTASISGSATRSSGAC